MLSLNSKKKSFSCRNGTNNRIKVFLVLLSSNFWNKCWLSFIFDWVLFLGVSSTEQDFKLVWLYLHTVICFVLLSFFKSTFTIFVSLSLKNIVLNTELLALPDRWIHMNFCRLEPCDFFIYSQYSVHHKLWQFNLNNSEWLP